MAEIGRICITIKAHLNKGSRAFQLISNQTDTRLSPPVIEVSQKLFSQVKFILRNQGEQALSTIVNNAKTLGQRYQKKERWKVLQIKVSKN